MHNSKDGAALVKQLTIWLEALRTDGRAIPQDNSTRPALMSSRLVKDLQKRQD